jgi:Flp pilus assembly protein TadD
MRHRSRSAPFLAAVMAIFAFLVAPGVALAQNNGLVSTVGAYLAARAAVVRSDPAAAAYYYRIVFDRNPSNTALASTILRLWVEAGQVDQAVPVARMLVSTDPGNEPARLVLAADAIRNGRFDDAAADLDAIAGDSLSDVTTGILGAWMEAGQGQFDQALATLEGMDSSDLFQNFHAALIADMAGRSDEALNLISQVYEPGSSQRLTEAYARLLARNGFSEQAEGVINAFLQDVPGHPSLTQLLAAIQAGDDIAPLVVNAKEGAAEVFYGLASSLVAGNDYDTAIAYLQYARYIGPAGDLSSVLLGQVLQAQGRHREATHAFDSVGVDSPFHTLAAIGASVSDAIRGLSERAATRLEPIAADDPSEVSVVNTLAGIYRDEGRWEDASALLSATIDVLPTFIADDWRLFYQRGVAYERMDQWPEAETDFRRALALSPDQPDVLNYLGYSWIDRGENYLEALDMIQRAVQQRPDSGYIIDSLGWAYFKLGNYESAVETLEQAAELTPSHPEVLEHLGDAYWRAGRQLEAVYQWNQALAFSPDDETTQRLKDKIDNGLPELEEGMAAPDIMNIN